MKFVSRSKKQAAPWSELVRRVFDTIPDSALIDIDRQRAIQMVSEKYPNMEITTSRKNVVGIILQKAKKSRSMIKGRKSRIRKITRKQTPSAPWANMEGWEIALIAAKFFGGDLQLTAQKFAEANVFLQKISKVGLEFSKIASAS